MAMMVNEVKANRFLLEDGVTIAKKDQRSPQVYHNLEKMLAELVKNSAS